MIEQHLQILKNKGMVAFGKVKSKLRDYEHPNEEVLETIYNEVSHDNPMQLFLTDYNSIYVANVISVKQTKTKIIKAPKYYDDLRLIVKNDFQKIRDNILANLILWLW